MIKVNLEKSAQAFRLNLAKSGVTPVQAELAFVLDVSGSFDDEHRAGITNDLLTRLVPWGMVFDPNGELDVFTFSNGPGHACHVGTINKGNYEGYIERKIIDKVPGYKGGTHFSHVLAKVLGHFGWGEGEAQAKPRTGFFAKLFGGAERVAEDPASNKKRSIVILVTDGQNDDEAQTRKVLSESEARRDGVYFLFIGISNQEKKFRFLHQIADEFGNTGLVVIDNLKAFVEQTDDELNDLLFGEELREWLKN